MIIPPATASTRSAAPSATATIFSPISATSLTASSTPATT